MNFIATAKEDVQAEGDEDEETLVIFLGTQDTRRGRRQVLASLANSSFGQTDGRFTKTF